MIVEFNPTIFDASSHGVLQNVSKILLLLSEHRHLFDLRSILSCVFDEEDNYIFDESKLSSEFLSVYDRGRVREFFEFVLDRNAYITAPMEKYLTRLRVGLDEGDVEPELALRILTDTSRIIVENATNDWKFICGIARKYRRHPRRRSIYEKVDMALDSLWVVAEQAGGKGQIRTRIEDLSKTIYRTIFDYKLMTLFDSDRNSSGELNHEQGAIIGFLKERKIDSPKQAVWEEGDVVVWHMLYKREIENYVPLQLVQADDRIPDGERRALLKLSPDELDFVDYERQLSGVDVKSDFPQMFLSDWERSYLEARCEHHKVDIELPNGTLEAVSEIEQILLKIAKLI